MNTDNSYPGTVRIENDGPLAIVTLDNGAKANSVNHGLLGEFAQAFRTVAQQDGVGAVMLQGVGRVFCAGDDLDEAAGLDLAGWTALIERFQDVTRAMHELDVPVVGALNGIAVGGGAEVAIACDIRAGVPQTAFAFPETGIGLTITNGATLLLQRILRGSSLLHVLTGDRIDAATAVELGLVDKMFDSVEEIRAWAGELAALCAGSPEATRLHLQMLRPTTAELEATLANEVAVAAEVWDNPTARQSLADWRAKRSES